MQKELGTLRAGMPGILVDIATALSGALVSVVTVAIVNVALGLVLEDWSGLHPFYRLWNIPIQMAVVTAWCLLLIVGFRLIFRRRISAFSKLFAFGLISGCVGFGAILRPVFGSHAVLGWVVMFVVAVSSLSLLIFSEKTIVKAKE